MNPPTPPMKSPACLLLRLNLCRPCVRRSCRSIRPPAFLLSARALVRRVPSHSKPKLCSAWPADDRREKLLHGLLLNLLRIRDSKQPGRISVFFEDPQLGLLPVLKSQLIEVCGVCAVRAGLVECLVQLPLM